MDGLHHGRDNGKGHITDPQADDGLVRIGLLICRHLFGNGGKKIAARQFQIVFIDLKHNLLLLVMKCTLGVSPGEH